MRRVIAFVVFFMYLTAIPVLVNAQEDSHKKLAEEFLKTINIEENLQSNVNEMVKMQIQQNPHLLPYEDIMVEFYSKYLGWNSLKDEFINIYVEEFSKEEIKKLIDFYASPTGQKVTKKMPKLFQRGAQLGSEKVQSHITELQQMIREEANEIQNK